MTSRAAIAVAVILVVFAVLVVPKLVTAMNFWVDGTSVDKQPGLNLIAGDNVVLSGVADAVNERVNITITAATTTFTGSIAIPNGAGGTTVDAAGELTVDTASSTLNFHDGTAERVVRAEETRSFIIEVPTASDDMAIFPISDPVTLTESCYLPTGGTSWTGQFQEFTSTGASSTATDTQAADTTATSDAMTCTSTYSDAAIADGNVIGFKTTSVSGEVTRVLFSFRFRWDP